MATKFSQVVGRSFSKNVKKEFERRKGLNQDFSNTSELYQPYFILRRIKSLDPVTKMKEVEDSDYVKGRFSKLGKVFEDGYDISYGLDDLEGDSDRRGFPAITSVTFELEDFTFYRTTINFEIPDIKHFKEFREKWLQFGAPVELEWGRHSPVNFEIDDNEDIHPNKEKRLGNVVKFDYGVEGNSRSITGTLIIYSVTWLPVLQEGSMEDHESEGFKNWMTDELLNAVENPLIFSTDYDKIINRISRGGIDRSNQNFVEARNTKRDKVEDYFWGVTRLADETFAEKAEDTPAGRRERHGELIHPDSDVHRFNTLLPIKVIDRQYTNVDNITEYVNCHLKLDVETFGTELYYFISLELIEKLLNRYYNSLSSYNRKLNVDEKNIFSFNLSNTVINNYSFRGIRSRMPQDVVINPREKRYSLDEDGVLVEDDDGEHFKSSDIYISAPTFFRLLDQSRGGYSFVDSLLDKISSATGQMVDLSQKKEEGEIINGSVITTGITVFDSSLIRDNKDDSYTSFKLQDAREKIKGFSFQTEIADEIANMIFFRSRGEFINEEDSRDINDVFLFSKEYNLRYLKEIVGDRLNKLTDKLDSHYDHTYGSDRDETVSDIDRFQHRSMRNTRQKINNEVDRYSEIEYDEESNRWYIKGVDDNEYDLNEYYKIRQQLTNRIEQRFDIFNSDISRNISDNIDRRLLRTETEKDKLLNILTFVSMFFSQTIETQRTDYYANGNFRLPYNLSFEVEGISGILPSQALKVDLQSFDMDYRDQEEALFVVTGLSHTFEGNSWITTLSCSFWIDFKENTFLNSYEEGATSDIMTNEYRNILATLRLIFLKRIKKDLEIYNDNVNLLNEETFLNFVDSDETIYNYLFPSD